MGLVGAALCWLIDHQPRRADQIADFGQKVRLAFEADFERDALVAAAPSAAAAGKASRRGAIGSPVVAILALSVCCTATAALLVLHRQLRTRQTQTQLQVQKWMQTQQTRAAQQRPGEGFDRHRKIS